MYEFLIYRGEGKMIEGESQGYANSTAKVSQHIPQRLDQVEKSTTFQQRSYPRHRH